MKFFQIFFLFILLLQINSQINNNTDNNSIKIINNINKTNETVNILQRNNIIQKEHIKIQKIENKNEEIKLSTGQDNSQKINNNINQENNEVQINNNSDQIKNNGEIKNDNMEVNNNEQINNNKDEKNIGIKQDKIGEQNLNQNNIQQNNEENKKDIKNNNEQKQNAPQPKKEEIEKDKKIDINEAKNNNQQKKADKVKEKEKNDNPKQQYTNIQHNKVGNQTEKDKLKEGVIKSDKEKPFNLTESLINFFKETFGNKTNETKTESEEDRKRKQVEEETKKRLEAEKEKRRKEEIKKLEKIKMEEKKKREKEKKAENERLEFFKILSNKSFDEVVPMHLSRGEKETLYLELDSFKKIYIAITTSDLDLQEKFNFYFSGPNARGRTAVIYQIFNKNYIFWEYETLRKGEFIAEITNRGTKDNDLVFFFGKNEGKKKDRIDTQKIDKISMLLNEIDGNVNQIRNKKSIEIKQANSHNKKVTNNNKWIVIYSIVEICTMSLVFLIQSCYINSLVKKV